MHKLKTRRQYVNGNEYIKSSNCVVCPICERSIPINNLFLKQFSAPARRALENIGISKLNDLANYKENEVSDLHGIGANALNTMKTLMETNNINFKKNG